MKIKQIVKILILALLISSGFFIHPKAAKAADADIVINEIGAYEKSENEWIEIYNKGTGAVDVTGWKFYEDQTNHKLSAFQNDFVIDPGEYAIIASVAENFKNLHPDFAGTILDSSWSSLKESGEEIGLKNSKGDIIELFTYLPCPKTSLQRIDANLNDYTEKNWLVHATSDSAGRANEFPADGQSDQNNGTGDQNNQDQDNNQDNQNNQSNDDNSGGQNTNDQNNQGDNTGGQDSQDGNQNGQSGGDDSSGSNTGDQSNSSSQTISSPHPKIISSGTVVINEFVSDPADGEVEWVELYNKNSFDIDLTGWTILDGSEKATSLSGTLGSNYDNRFYVVEKPKGKLNNDGDAIILKDNKMNIIDAVFYGNWDGDSLEQNAPVAKDPNSVARIFDGADSFNNKEDFVVTQTPTKGLPNIITLTDDDKKAKQSADQASADTEKQTNAEKQIIINEIYPNPPGSDLENEFIELKNTGDQDVDLADWKISNSSKMKFKITTKDFASTVLKPNNFFVIERKKSGLALKNNKETVKLIDPEDKIIQTVKYSEDDNVPENVSYVQDESGDWVWTTTLTKGQENIVTKLNHAPEINFDCPTSAEINEEIICDASDSYDLDDDTMNFVWQANGQTSTEPLTSFKFDKPGTVTISLVVSDGKDESTETQKIKVTDPAKETSTKTTKSTVKSGTKTKKAASTTSKSQATTNDGQETSLDVEPNNQSSNVLKYLVTSAAAVGLGIIAVTKKKKKAPD